MKAYQYTSLTSVMLLDCWTIPCVMLLTWLFLKTKYRFRKIAGVVVCVAGLVMVIFSDVHAGDRSGNETGLFMLSHCVIPYPLTWSLKHFTISIRMVMMNFANLYFLVFTCTNMTCRRQQPA